MANEAVKDIFDDFEGLFSDLGNPATNAEAEQEKGVTAEPVATANKSSITIQNTNNSNLVTSAQAKLSMIKREMNEQFMERDAVIDCMMYALVSGQSILMLGDPGTAKSAITYELCSRIENGKYFQWMLNKTSDPSEILGPYSIKEMENDKFMRITTGKLPEAHIAFIDECFKANAPVLNILLPIMNEKIFYNDGKPNNIPLMTMIGASNEGPEDESLNAFYDRFLFRINVHYVKDAANKKRMYTNFINNHRGLGNLTSKTTITIEEIQALTEASKSIVVPKEIINKFVKFINDLDKQTIHISDRRQNECFKILQASAIVHGRQQVGIDDFKSLIYVLWDKEEQIPLIESTITKMINPFDDQFKGFKDNFNIIKKDIESCTDENEKSNKSLEAKGSIEKLTSKLNKLINDASKNGKDIKEFTDFRDEMVAYSNKIVQDALGASLGISSDDGDLF